MQQDKWLTTRHNIKVDQFWGAELVCGCRWLILCMGGNRVVKNTCIYNCKTYFNQSLCRTVTLNSRCWLLSYCNMLECRHVFNTVGTDVLHCWFECLFLCSTLHLSFSCGLGIAMLLHLLPSASSLKHSQNKHPIGLWIEWFHIKWKSPMAITSHLLCLEGQWFLD